MTWKPCTLCNLLGCKTRHSICFYIGDAHMAHYIEFNKCLNYGNYSDVWTCSWKHMGASTFEFVRHKLLCKEASGVHFKSSKIEYIVKTLSNSKRGSKRITNEISALSLLYGVQGVIKLADYGKLMIDIMYKKHFILMERCRGGDLFNFFTSLKRPLSVNEIDIIMKQLVSTLNACHSKGVIHIDIKMENIGLMKKGDLYSLRLLDFGASRIIDNSFKSHYKNLYFETSPHYTAPEILLHKDIKDEDLPAIDFWGLGIILYILLTSKYPFDGPCIQKSIIKGEWSWPDNFICIKRHMNAVDNWLSPDPEKRMNTPASIDLSYFSED